MDTINHIALRCIHPTINEMHTDRHRIGLSSRDRALSKGRYGSSLIGMDACLNEKLLQQGIQVPENITRTIPGWGFPYWYWLLCPAPEPSKCCLCALNPRPTLTH
eukprot:977236-Pelagomonas_calceolata.AAC.1